MPKILTHEFVKTNIELENYILLEDIYVNNKQKMKAICNNGHHIYIRWNDWRSGVRCSVCVGVAKYTIDYINHSFVSEDYQLLSNEYRNKDVKLDYVCSNGHQHSITFRNWLTGYRCPYCAGQGKPSLDYIKNSFSKVNYKLLSDKYINSKTKLHYVCNNGHNHSIIWANWNNGVRCPTCAIINRSGPGHPLWKGGISCEPYCQDWTKEYKEFIKERDGYKCLNPDCWKRDERLHIHHIDYNKKNCGPSNLITLCGSCNSRANVDRNWHKAWYQAVMYNRYLNRSLNHG